MAGASNIAQIRRVLTAVTVIRGTPSLDSATAKVAISLEIHRKVFFPCLVVQATIKSPLVQDRLQDR